MSQWLKFLKFLEFLKSLKFLGAIPGSSAGDDVFSGELSSLLSLGLLLDLVLLILGLFDGGIKLLALAIAVSLCVLHV